MSSCKIDQIFWRIEIVLPFAPTIYTQEAPTVKCTPSRGLLVLVLPGPAKHPSLRSRQIGIRFVWEEQNTD